MDNAELEAHKQRIDQQIKAGIDKMVESGDIQQGDFVPNEDGDLMITIHDEHGDAIVFNYTQVRVHSYGGRINPPPAL